MSYTNQTKNQTSWDRKLEFLLQEIGDFLLQEDGGKIILEPSLPGGKNNATYTNQTKNVS